MGFSNRIAWRYLWGKKSTQAIHIISGVSILGLTIGTASLILVLSVFNGLEDLIGKLVGSFNPDVKIEISKGKTFVIDSNKVKQLRAIPGIAAVSLCLQEIALLEYQGSQVFATVKGVDSQFSKVNHIDSTIIEGSYGFDKSDDIGAVLGSGVARKLGTDLDNEFEKIRIYTPEKNAGQGLGNPFRSRLLSPQGVFYIQQDFDNEYVLTNLPFVQDLIDRPNQVSSIELRVGNKAQAKTILAEVRQVLGPGFDVKDRIGQDMSLKKLMQMEKWMSYAILCLTFILVAFNLVGSLWMVVLDKKEDIYLFRSMGANSKSIRNVFILLGLFYTFVGLIMGIILALLLYYLQITVGLIRMPDVFVVDRYPVSLRGFDIAVVAITVLFIGCLASIPAAARASRLKSLRPEL
ncbi:MAG: ABC transporter permease [Saprospiraceae bacterium]